MPLFLDINHLLDDNDFTFHVTKKNGQIAVSTVITAKDGKSSPQVPLITRGYLPADLDDGLAGQVIGYERKINGLVSNLDSIPEAAGKTTPATAAARKGIAAANDLEQEDQPQTPEKPNIPAAPTKFEEVF